MHSADFSPRFMDLDPPPSDPTKPTSLDKTHDQVPSVTVEPRDVRDI